MILTVGRKKATCATSPEGKWLQPRAGWPSRWKYQKTYFFSNLYQSSIFLFSMIQAYSLTLAKHFFSMITKQTQGAHSFCFEGTHSHGEKWPTCSTETKNLVTVQMVMKMVKYWQYFKIMKYFRSSTTDISTVWILCLTSSLLLWRRREKEKKELMYD